MVDALCEACRVLSPDGVLVDLRPMHATSCPLELVLPDQALRIGEVDASGAAGDDRAADRAIARCVESGRLQPYREGTFSFEHYWDTVDEMEAFLQKSLRLSKIHPSYSRLRRVHRAWSARSAGPVRFRATRPVWLAVYRKAT